MIGEIDNYMNSASPASSGRGEVRARADTRSTRSKNDGQPRVVVLSAFGDNMGGTERWTNGFVAALHRDGYDVSWGSLFPSPRPFQYQRPCEIVTRTFYNFHPGRFWRVLNFMGIAPLRHYLQTLSDKTLIICTDSWMMEHILKTGVRTGVGTALPLIGMHHFQFPKRRRALRVLKRVYRQANAVVFLTESDAELARSNGILQAEHIHNPQEPVTIRRVGKSKVMVALGRLTKEKSFHHAIDAWSLVCRRHPEWELHIYGDGPEETFLRKRIARLGLQHAVKLLGPTTEPLQVLSNCAVHVSTSQTEGFPLNILEASSVGVPTVAFNCSAGVAEQISDGNNGILVSQNSTESLADSLITLIENVDLREQMGIQAQKDATRFAPEKIWARWSSLISRVRGE